MDKEIKKKLIIDLYRHIQSESRKQYIKGESFETALDWFLLELIHLFDKEVLEITRREGCIYKKDGTRIKNLIEAQEMRREEGFNQ